MIYQEFFKPLMDITLAAMLLIFLSPIFIFVMIILVSTTKGSPFFIQTRAGYQGKPFRIIKFKTMKDKQEHNPLTDIERLTKVGFFLRKTSIDELPQLLNVLKGDLSLVGPRPLLMQYLPHYNKEQARRHEVRPGITGWAQVHGRQSITFIQRFELDVWYVKNISFILDIKILLKTFINTLKSKGVIENEGYWKE